MNTKHQTFLLEYYRTGDKKQAYRKAYPQAKESSITNAVNRLLARQDIAEAISEQETKHHKDLEAEIAEHYKNKIIGIYEAQAYLSQIIRGELKREKWVKKKDHWETTQVTPTISETLRALNTFFRLNNQHQNQRRHFERSEKSPKHLQPADMGDTKFPLQGAKGVLPPEPIKEQSHPFGNIYPENYPGPCYDPGDPNTKEKIQNLRLDRLTGSPVAGNNNNPQQTPSVIVRKNGEAIPQEQQQLPPSPPPVIARNEAISREQEQAHNNAGKQHHQHRVLQKTTTNNNKVPPSGGGVVIPPYGSDGHYAAKQRAWRIKLEQLRKEGWETASELSSEVYNTYLVNQHSGTYKMLKQFEKAVQSRNLPAEEREKIIQETGWEYHPEHPHVMRREKRNL